MKTTIRIFGITLAILITNLVIGCSDNDESIPTAATTQNIPAAPIGESVQIVDEGSTLAALKVTGENIKWYAFSRNSPIIRESFFEPTQNDSITQSRRNRPLPLNLVLQNLKSYYATQTIGGVESQDELVVTVQFIDNVIHKK